MFDFSKELKEQFVGLTKIDCSVSYMEKGDGHKPTRLNNEKGVYVFLLQNVCFKVGKAGPKSGPRWSSQHYNWDSSTPSSFTKSISKDMERFKSFFPKEKWAEIDSLDKENSQSWIKNNISRIEFKISDEESDIALNLLEALVQFRLKPEYEGKSA